MVSRVGLAEGDGEWSFEVLALEATDRVLHVGVDEAVSGVAALRARSMRGFGLLV